MTWHIENHGWRIAGLSAMHNFPAYQKRPNIRRNERTGKSR
jgi:hypothetical protein